MTTRLSFWVLLPIAALWAVLSTCGDSGPVVSGQNVCQGDDDCDGDSVCDRGVCARICRTSAQCLPEEVCTSSGLCVPVVEQITKTPLKPCVLTGSDACSDCRAPTEVDFTAAIAGEESAVLVALSHSGETAEALQILSIGVPATTYSDLFSLDVFTRSSDAELSLELPVSLPVERTCAAPIFVRVRYFAGQAGCVPRQSVVIRTNGEPSEVSVPITLSVIAKEVCDGVDNDCNEGADEGCDDDGDLYCDSAMTTAGTPPLCPLGGGDCQDADARSNPRAAELCDNLDNNCNGSVDEGCDTDADLYCDAGMEVIGLPLACALGEGDCDDQAPGIRPDAAEACDNVDNDCDGAVDEGCDSDGDDYCNDQAALSGVVDVCPLGGGDCNDTNPAISPGACLALSTDCADGYCNTATRQCAVAPRQDGAACDDGSLCTDDETCQGGVCASPNDCATLSDACNTGGCNESAGLCETVPVDNGTPCDDGEPCTVADQCAGGNCAGGALSDGSPCSDADPCTAGDQCTGGVCGGTLLSPCVTCPGGVADCDDGNVCTDESCVAGACYVVNDDSNTCSDGDVCTVGDACVNGACVPGTRTCGCVFNADCNDGNPCTTDICGGGGMCTHVNNSDACNDGNPCTLGDTCGGGTCNATPFTCDDGNPCTNNVCNGAGGCSYPNNTASCDDGDACTSGDVCGGGVCNGTPYACDDANLCTDDSCNGDGSCTFAPNTDPCDDGEACTHTDTCGGGLCLGTAYSCDDNSVCTDDICLGNGSCNHPAVNDGGSCDTGAGDGCTVGLCNAGTCVPGLDFVGGMLLFTQACPAGFTEAIGYRERYLMGEDGDGVYGETGGSTVHQHSLPGHQHFTSTDGGHGHNYTLQSPTEPQVFAYDNNAACLGGGPEPIAHGSSHGHSGLASDLGDSAHAHSSMESAELLAMALNLPAYREAVVCTATSSHVVIPSGAVALFTGACPTGWNDEGALFGNRMLRGHDGILPFDGSGGSDIHGHGSAHAHAVEPNDFLHTHSPSASGGASTTVVPNSSDYAWFASTGHTHPVALSAIAAPHGHSTGQSSSVFSSAVPPAWQEVTVCRKDATANNQTTSAPGIQLLWANGCPVCWTPSPAPNRLLRGHNGMPYGEQGGASIHDHSQNHDHPVTSAAGNHSHPVETIGGDGGQTQVSTYSSGCSAVARSASPVTHSHRGFTSADGSHAHTVQSAWVNTTADAHLPPYKEVTLCRPQ